MRAVTSLLVHRDSATDWLPAIGVLATFCWAYYAYVHVFCPALVKDDEERFLLASLFLLLLLLAVWSFLRAITAPIPPVPACYYVSYFTRRQIAHSNTSEQRRELLESLGATRGILTRAKDGGVRYCDQCGLVKPDRCHHCSCCKRCILKMDHHCPWLNNCVCFSSYKFFLLTLLYAALLAAFTFVTTSSYAWDAANPLQLAISSLVHIVLLAAVGGTLTLILGGFFSVHVRLVYNNETTLEGLRACAFVDHGDSFDLGPLRNFTQVFGTRFYLWPFPVFTSLGDGVHFPTRLHPDPGSIAVQEQGPLGRQEAPGRLGENVPVILSAADAAIADLTAHWADPAKIQDSESAQPSIASESAEGLKFSEVELGKAANMRSPAARFARSLLRPAANAKLRPLVHSKVETEHVNTRVKTPWYIRAYHPSASSGCIYDS